MSHLLLTEELLDELHLWIHPQFVEASTSDLLFRHDLSAAFTLEDTRVLSNGILIASYSVAAQA